MRRLPAALAGLTLALSLSTPAWASDGPQRHSRRFSSRSDSGAAPRPYGDREQHDDPSILF